MEFLTGFRQAGDVALLILRLSLGVIFLLHGKSKWALWKAQPSMQLPAPLLRKLRILSIAEPLGAIAVAIGLFTQLAALGFCLVMLGAIPLKRKQGLPFLAKGKEGGWEFEFLILAASIALVIVGAGQYSLDQVLFWKPRIFYGLL